MEKSKYRLPTTLMALVIGLAIALYLQFFANSDPQVDERRETTAISEAPESLARDELPTLSRNTYSDKDGLFAMVEWRNRGRLSYDEYPQTYAGLRVLAEEGDVEATRRLTVLLRSCRHAALPMPEAEISEIVAEMQATYSYPMLRDGKFEFLLSATGELSHKMSSAEFESFIDGWHSNVMKCNAVTVAQREEADYWLGQLEVQGGVQSLSYEATQEMDREEKFTYVDNMWAMGDPSALASYSELYADPELQLLDPSARVKSYAYIYAFYEALIETAKYHSDADRLAELQWALKIVRKNYAILLSEHEFREAHELARQIIADNENCCMRPPPTGY